jgi:hypothetical protein
MPELSKKIIRKCFLCVQTKILSITEEDKDVTRTFQQDCVCDMFSPQYLRSNADPVGLKPTTFLVL